MSEKTASTTKELAAALAERTDIIIIEGSLGDAVVRIIFTGKIAWALAIASIATAVYSLVGSSGTAAVFSVASAATAVGIIGYQATKFALELALAAVQFATFTASLGIGALNMLREYTIQRRDGSLLVLALRAALEARNA